MDTSKLSTQDRKAAKRIARSPFYVKQAAIRKEERQRLQDKLAARNDELERLKKALEKRELAWDGKELSKLEPAV